MKDWLYPGAKVQCVEDEWVGGTWQSATFPSCPLRKGAVYTVRHVFLEDIVGVDGKEGQQVCVVLEEVRKPKLPHHHGGWDARRFRPLTKRNTDTQVEKLKRLLNTTPADLEAVE